MTQSRYSICITELATEMPRCFSISIQSDVAYRDALRALTLPAMWMAPAYSSSFSVSVVLPASGCEMMAKVLRRETSDPMLIKGAHDTANRRAEPLWQPVFLVHNIAEHAREPYHPAAQENGGVKCLR